ncbi:hypothetical protein [Sodalis praecaptivus]|uniref:hypothetical protein n=1 Tax=Sodalis praecaptivus TaxID=1239307 RepID=UPI0031FA20E8
MARSAIGGVVARVIASRAATVAANDAVYLSLVNNTSRSLAVSAGSQLSTITSSGLFKTTSNVITWGGVGYTLGQIGHDDLLPEGVGVDDKGNYYIKAQSGNSPVNVGDDLSYTTPFYAYYNEKYYEGFNRHSIALKVFYDIIADGGALCGFPRRPCKFSAITSVTDANFGNVTIDYSGILDGKESWGYQAVQVKDTGVSGLPNPETSTEEEKDPAKVGKYIIDKLSDIPLDLNLLAKTINSLWMDAASKPDYQGVPFTSSNPVTADEIKAVASDAGRLSQQEWVKPAQIDKNAPVEIVAKNPGPSIGSIAEEAGSLSDADLPEINLPDMQEPPGGNEILKPLLDLLPLEGVSLTPKYVACPVISFDIWEKHIVIDNHCELIEKIRPLFAIFSLLIWSLAAFRVVFSA